MSNPLFPQEAQPIKLYWFPLSGHAHRAQLMLSLLDLPHELITVDLVNGEHKTAEFLERHPFGQVPVMDDNGTILWDSHAIIHYLAQKYDANGTWLPSPPTKAAQVQQWLAVSAGLLVNGPASARLVKVFGTDHDHAKAVELAHNLLTIIEKHLTNSAFLVGDQPTIADVAGYSYIAHAPEGEVDLTPYPTIQKWLAKIEALPGFVPMKKS